MRINRPAIEAALKGEYPQHPTIDAGFIANSASPFSALIRVDPYAITATREGKLYLVPLARFRSSKLRILDVSRWRSYRPGTWTIKRGALSRYLIALEVIDMNSTLAFTAARRDERDLQLVENLSKEI